LRLDVALEFNPSARWLERPQDHPLLVVPLHLFSTTPYRAVIALEVVRRPDDFPDNGSVLGGESAVPPLRAWAWYQDGIRVTSHHMYPDRSVCAFMAGQWLPGIDDLQDYVASLAMWIAKSLHLQLFDRWPGRQHYGAYERVRRNRGEECCGCGAARLYRDCHQEDDRACGAFDRALAQAKADLTYRMDLTRRGLRGRGPDWVLDLNGPALVRVGGDET